MSDGSPGYHFIEDVGALLDAAPEDSIISRTFYRDGPLSTILFVFAAGQALSEHTAAVPAIIHILEGEAEIGLGGKTHAAWAGSWLHMPARLPHSVLARTPVKMLLLMLPGGE